MDLKRCNHCRLEKPLSDFYRNRHKADGRHHWCAECVNIDVAKLRAGAPRKYRAHTRPSSQGGAHRRGLQKPDGVPSQILSLLAGRALTVAEIGGTVGVSTVHARSRLAQMRKLGLVANDGDTPRRWTLAG